MSPCRSPQSASISAWAATSASERPSSPFSCGTCAAEDRPSFQPVRVVADADRVSKPGHPQSPSRVVSLMFRAAPGLEQADLSPVALVDVRVVGRAQPNSARSYAEDGRAGTSAASARRANPRGRACSARFGVYVLDRIDDRRAADPAALPTANSIDFATIASVTNGRAVVYRDDVDVLRHRAAVQHGFLPRRPALDDGPTDGRPSEAESAVGVHVAVCSTSAIP